MEDEKRLLSPKEVAERKQRKVTEEPVTPEIAKEPLPEDFDKYSKKGGKVRIEYESAGRFSIPAVLYFSDYSVRGVNDIISSRADDILESMVGVLNDCIEDDIQVEEMLIEEMYETLIGMKVQFNTPKHTHRWMCGCQDEVSRDARKLSEWDMELTSLKYAPIEEAEKKLREDAEPILAEMPDDEFDQYLIMKYKENDGSHTREKEVEKIKISDAIMLNDEAGNIYQFRYTRIGDLVQGYKIASQKFNARIRSERAKNPPPGMKGGDFRASQEVIVDRYEHEKEKEAILNTKALSLVSINGKVLTTEEKIKKFADLKRGILIDYSSFMDTIKFGIQDEREIECNLCGKKNKEQFGQKFNPIELVPLDDTSDDDAKRKFQKPSGSLVYFGTKA